jgi:hypothetical protein
MRSLGPKYERLRAEYDAAFHRLSVEVQRLRSEMEQPSPHRAAEELTRRNADEALSAYRKCRDNLAKFLISHGKQQEVEALAYRLWEEAGHPIGKPQEHWYRAEQLLGRR